MSFRIEQVNRAYIGDCTIKTLGIRDYWCISVSTVMEWKSKNCFGKNVLDYWKMSLITDSYFFIKYSNDSNIPYLSKPSDSLPRTAGTMQKTEAILQSGVISPAAITNCSPMASLKAKQLPNMPRCWLETTSPT